MSISQEALNDSSGQPRLRGSELETCHPAGAGAATSLPQGLHSCHVLPIHVCPPCIPVPEAWPHTRLENRNPDWCVRGPVLRGGKKKEKGPHAQRATSQCQVPKNMGRKNKATDETPERACLRRGAGRAASAVLRPAALAVSSAPHCPFSEVGFISTSPTPPKKKKYLQTPKAFPGTFQSTFQ